MPVARRNSKNQLGWVYHVCLAGLGVTTAAAAVSGGRMRLRLWRLANWFWHRKMDRFFLVYPQEADYRCKDSGELVIHNGW